MWFRFCVIFCFAALILPLSPSFAASGGCLKVFGKSPGDLNEAKQETNLYDGPLDRSAVSYVNENFKILKNITAPIYECGSSGCTVSLSLRKDGKFENITKKPERYLFICHTKSDPCNFCSSKDAGSVFIHLIWEGGNINYGIDNIDNPGRDYKNDYNPDGSSTTVFVEKIRNKKYAKIFINLYKNFNIR